MKTTILSIILLFIVAQNASSINDVRQAKKYSFKKISLIRIIAREAKNVGIPPGLLVELCRKESSLQMYVDDSKLLSANRSYISHGLCQVQLRVAKDRGFGGSLADLYNPEINANYSARQLKWCKSKFRLWTWALDCYRRGYSKVRKYKIKIKDYEKGGYVRSIMNRFYLNHKYI